MKQKIGSVLIALMGLFSGTAAWGAETAANPTIVNRSCQPERGYVVGDIYKDGYSCVSNAVADASDNDTLDLLEQVTSSQTVIIDKPLTLKLKCSDADKCNLAFNVVSGGVLTVYNYSSFRGRFVVEGGKLSLNGGVFYTDGAHPVISTTGGETNNVVVAGASIKGQYNKSTTTTRTSVPAVRLDGAGTFSMVNGASIEPYVYYNGRSYTNSYSVGISATCGDARFDGSSIVADDYGLLIGSDEPFDGSGTFTLSNHVSIVSTRNFGIYAYATNTALNLSIADSTITALDGGIKLDCTADAMDPALHQVFLDGDTHINTRSAYGDYAIRDCTETKGWSVTIRRGVYYRMRKYIDDASTIAVTNKWIYQGPIVSSAVAWDPAGQDDNLTMTVTCDEKELIDVVFNGDGGYKEGKYTWGVDKNVSTNFLIAHGGSQSLAALTPEVLGMTNTAAMSVFAGWYLSVEEARALKNAQTAVSKSTTLYAGWKKCAVTFMSPEEEEVVGLASNVVGGTVNVSAFKPEQFGWENPGYAFAGWYLDRDYEGTAVSTFSIPVATNLYARWVEKSYVAHIEGTTNFYKSVSEAVAAATESNVVVLVQNAPDERMIPIAGTRTIALNGKSLGDSARASGTMFVVAGPDSCLQVLGEEGTVYGSIALDADAEVYLDGGTYVCKQGSVVLAAGARFAFAALDAVFKGAAEDEGVALDFSGVDGHAVLSNSTITCTTAAQNVDVAISVADCSVDLIGTTLSAAFCGIMSSNGVCSISKSSSITAPFGVLAYPSKISMSDSKILSSPSTTNGFDETYAFNLLAGGVGAAGCFISLSGNNDVVGGSYDSKSAHPLLVGGAIAYEGVWANALKKSISGGVYSHQGDQVIVTNSWVSNTDKCRVEWLDRTTFKVTDLAFTFKMQYEDWPDVVTNMYESSFVTNIVDEKTAETNAVRVVDISSLRPWLLYDPAKSQPTNSTFSGWSAASNKAEIVTLVEYGNPVTLYAVWTNAYSITYIANLTEEMKSKGATALTTNNPSVYSQNTVKVFANPYANAGGGHYEGEGWNYKNDNGTVTRVTAISNMTLWAANGAVVKRNPQDFELIAYWGNAQWEEDPLGTISYASGVIDESEWEADFVEKGEENPDNLPVADAWVINDGSAYYSTNVTVALPTEANVAWNDGQKAHVFSGWVAWYEDEEGNLKTSEVYSVEIAVATLTNLQERCSWDGVFHAVWDRGGTGGGGVSSFEGLYNLDDMPPLTGGDTYVGYIYGDDGVSIGTITIKCGVPRSDGSVSITAIVQEIGKPTRTFKGTGTYNGDTIDVSELVNGDYTITGLTINSKMVKGAYGTPDNNYTIEAGVNKFKGSEEDKEFADERLQPWLGKWMLIFQTEYAKTEYTGKGESDVNGEAFAYGYSHVLMDIKKNGKVALSGKLASGKEVSATATAIVGDNGICIPAVCSIYSGYDWGQFYLAVKSLHIDLNKAVALGLQENYKATSSRGGFGFTAWLSGDTNGVSYVNVNNISAWDSSLTKSMPFVATVAYTNHQRVADIALPTGERSMEFCVDTDTNDGWYSNIGAIDKSGMATIADDYIPANPSNSIGYVQFVNVSKSTSTNSGAVAKYEMKAANKAPSMKLVDGWVVPNKGGSNYANLKLKYKADKGLFTGSFKVYSVVTDDNGKEKLKSTKVNVSGGIAEGRGYGVGYADKAGSQPVLLVKPSEADKLLGEEPEPDEGDDSDENAESQEDQGAE